MEYKTKKKKKKKKKKMTELVVSWLLAYLTFQQHASISQGWICSDKFTCRHTEIEVADQTLYLT